MSFGPITTKLGYIVGVGICAVGATLNVDGSCETSISAFRMSTVFGALVGVAPATGPWTAAESAATGTKGYIDSFKSTGVSLTDTNDLSGA